MIIKTVYLSGPCTGVLDLNYPAFDSAACALRALGLTVISPSETGLPASASWKTYMVFCLKKMLDCDAIVLLHGWEKSKGAKIEANLAISVDIPAFSYDHFVDIIKKTQTEEVENDH